MNDQFIRLLELSAKGYCCSQIMLQLGLDNLDRENPDLIRSMAGLCMGNVGGTCGVLSGAACLLALYGGKGADLETENDQMPAMLQELADWFSEYSEGKYEGMDCEEIIGEIPSQPDMTRCGDLLVDTYAKVMEILDSYGFDPSEAPNA